MVAELSTDAFNEDGISLTADELTAYVSRESFPDHTADIYVATRADADAPFGAPVTFSERTRIPLGSAWAISVASAVIRVMSGMKSKRNSSMPAAPLTPPICTV